MHMKHNRTVTIKKEKLIEKIKENKETHIKEFNEAAKQLGEADANLKAGKLDISIRLTTPINRSSEYDKVAAWEAKEEIELTQAEFNEYVHDDNDSSKGAKFANSFYSGLAKSL